MPSASIKAITKTRIEVTTAVTLDQMQYEKILREAVGAPADARVEVENSYGGDITVTWTKVEYRDGP
jgi:hypothetical protein